MMMAMMVLMVTKTGRMKMMAVAATMTLATEVFHPRTHTYTSSFAGNDGDGDPDSNDCHGDGIRAPRPSSTAGSTRLPLNVAGGFFSPQARRFVFFGALAMSKANGVCVCLLYTSPSPRD